MKKIFFFLVFLVSITILNSCVMQSASEGPVNTDEINITEPISYGNGVYYFDCTEKVFAMSLSKFLSDSTKEIASITGDGTGGHGYDVGYFVVVKNK